MISSRYGFIYLHVPKTAGNSIHEALLPFSDDEKVAGGFRDGIERFEVTGPLTRQKHATLGDYAKVVDLDSYKIIISVRHPVDRALSFYFSPHRWVAKGNDDAFSIVAPAWDFDAFRAMLPTMKSATDFLLVDEDVHTPTFVVRYEQLADDLRSLATYLDLPELPFVHRNRSAGDTTVMDDLRTDRDVIDAVTKYFALDFRNFNYV